MSGEIQIYRPPLIVLQLIWCTFSVFLGIFGNSFILHSTIRHKALKMDKMSVWITKNVSVADILNCVFVLSPTTITQYSGVWIFGEIFCSIHFAYRFSFFAANTVLLNLMSLNKLSRCLFPLRNLSTSRRQRIGVTIATVISSAIPTFWTLYVWAGGYLETNHYGYSSHRRYMGSFGICLGGLTTDSAIIRDVSISIAVVLDGVMCVTMAITTAVILAYAVKMTNRPIIKRNIFVVIAICVTFIISFLPTCVWYMRQDLGYVFAEFAWSLAFISVWVNPVIHYVMNERFRQFTKSKLCFKACGRGAVSPEGENPVTAHSTV